MSTNKHSKLWNQNKFETMLRWKIAFRKSKIRIKILS